MKARQTNSETVTTRERGTARCGRGTGGRGPKPWVTPAKPNDRSLWDAGCLLRTNDDPSVGCVLSSRTTSFRETLTKDLVRFAKLRSCWVGLWLAPDGRARALSSVSSWDFSVFHGAAFASRLISLGSTPPFNRFGLLICIDQWLWLVKNSFWEIKCFISFCYLYLQ